MSSSQEISIVTVVGKSEHNCGYCHQKKTSHTFGIWAHSLTCEDYQALIDRGWRRSGKYLYKPDLRQSCCPQYTIRLDATKFKATKSQRKILHKFNRFIHGEWNPHQSSTTHSSESKKPPKKSTGKGDLSLIEMIHAGEQDKKSSDSNDHSFKIVLEPSSFTEEKYALYYKYQQQVHHDKPSDISKEGFRRFLVDTPMELERVNDQVTWGSYHQKYILDGTLIAVAVLDILPHCVSSVYYMYDTDYSFLGLGNYSALREISLTQEYHLSIPDLKYYYMGFYIHSCEKMKYKAKYHPSDLLDPETYDWYSFNDICKPLLDQHRYTSFSRSNQDIPTATVTAEQRHHDDDDSSNKRRATTSLIPPGWLDPASLDDDDLNQVLVLSGRNRVVPVTMLLKYHEEPSFRNEIKDYVASTGLELAHRMILC
ncbi:arginine-tRNA-protein transferase-like protein 1 [Halteromyces radiatus]|uniref:arginine-tRNA-protein transferase-like protein 1 n=1 Tax=Halteromyces radiatus TaxID=101107 RepID=UPI00221F9B2A|nr:arginine-tRNA-protein transferase-like protein 1 [Halteromyces radiatus]KAI8086376.1 arginine-tRNA-protein transferase-like protein 1 [Halteromyces radiatus]